MNKTAIVTGAGSGIGRSVAQALLKNDYRVVLAGRRKEPLIETAEQIGSPSRDWLAIPTDVCEADSVKQLFAKTVEGFGRVDLLFNNAGISVPAVPLDELPLSDWQRSVDTNLTGMFLCIQHAFRAMKKQDPQGGRIINNGSISAHVPRPRSVAYTATKHAVTGLTRSASLDGRQFGIACGQIDIGNAATPMTEKMTTGVPQANGTEAVEPTMDVENVAQGVLYMAGLPLNANVQFMTVMATEMPYIGRG